MKTSNDATKNGFEQKYGFFRPIIGEVVQNYLTCGDLKNGFARLRCGDCCEEYLLALDTIVSRAGGFAHHATQKRLSSSETS